MENTLFFNITKYEVTIHEDVTKRLKVCIGTDKQVALQSSHIPTLDCPGQMEHTFIRIH